MPIKVRALTTGGEVHPTPFVGPINHTVAIRLDVSTFTSAEVDAKGWLKPGVLVLAAGTPVTGVSQVIYGAVVEAVKLADSVAGLASAPDVDVTVALFCLINRDLLEDSMGRALNANELAAVSAAGSHVALTPT
jgi:hypothetical protein